MNRVWLLSVIFLFVSIAQLKPWSSLSAGWEANLCNCFPHIHTCCPTCIICHSSSCTLAWRISVTEFVTSWRLLQLKVIPTGAFCFSPSVLGSENKMLLIMLMSGVTCLSNYSFFSFFSKEGAMFIQSWGVIFTRKDFFVKDVLLLILVWLASVSG